MKQTLAQAAQPAGNRRGCCRVCDTPKLKLELREVMRQSSTGKLAAPSYRSLGDAIQEQFGIAVPVSTLRRHMMRHESRLWPAWQQARGLKWHAR